MQRQAGACRGTQRHAEALEVGRGMQRHAEACRRKYGSANMELSYGVYYDENKAVKTSEPISFVKSVDQDLLLKILGQIAVIDVINKINTAIANHFRIDVAYG